MTQFWRLPHSQPARPALPPVLVNADGTQQVLNDQQAFTLSIGEIATLQTLFQRLELVVITKPDWATHIWRNADGLFTSIEWQSEIYAVPWQEGETSYWAWSVRFGEDEFGVYVDLSIKKVTQRFRWIASGSFLMGSPPDEVNRYEGEAETLIGALDCSFITKSGTKTYGLSRFWDAKHGKAEKGLEIATLAVIDVGYNTAYAVSTWQTPPESKEGETRVHHYVRHFKADCHGLPKCVRYIATDAYYTKALITEAILEKGYHQVGKLRCDANLRHLFTGEQKPRGRRKVYAGKVIIGDVSQLTFVEKQGDVSIYTAVVNCVNLKRNVRIVYLLRKTAQGSSYALLFSTDTALDALSVHRYYKARFQIEFLFRDAKQFTGLCDCQARSEAALHSHFNASFAALNLIKWQDRENSPIRKPISIGSWKTRFFNTLLIERIFSNSALDLSLFKSSPLYEEICNFGAVAR
jgi:hypothetical protein